MLWERPVVATILVEQLAHTRYGTASVPVLALMSVALSSVRRVTIGDGGAMDESMGSMMYSDDGERDSGDEHVATQRTDGVCFASMNEAVCFMLVAPLNLSSITLRPSIGVDDITALSTALRDNPCHAFLTGLHVPMEELGGFASLSTMNAPTFIDAAGGLRYLTSLTASGDATMQLLRAVANTVRSVSVATANADRLDMGECRALRRVVSMLEYAGPGGGVAGLAEAVFPRGVRSLGTKVGFMATMTRLDISNTQVRSIGDDFLAMCFTLTAVEFPTSLTSLGRYAMGDCGLLTVVDFSHTQLHTVGSGLLTDCGGLTSVSFPAVLAFLGGNALTGCRALQRVDLSHTMLSSAGHGLLWDAPQLSELRLPECFDLVLCGAPCSTWRMPWPPMAEDARRSPSR
jgi:hypothetical protein